MAKPFKNLVRRMSPEARKRIRQRTKAMLLEMNLQELRQRCTELTQNDVAKLLDVTQAYVSKFERRGDMLLSTLYAYVKALGGKLEIRARVPGGRGVRVTQFERLGDLAALTGKRRKAASG